MFKISTAKTPPSTAERLPLVKKPIFREPVAQGIIFLSMLAAPVLEYLHVPHKVFVYEVCFSIGLDVALVAGLVWKAERAKRR